MSGFDLVIRGGQLVTESGVLNADLAVAGGRIAAIEDRISGECEVVEAGNLLVLPGGVDAHVHLQMPSGSTCTSEDWTSGTRAAVFGGTTTVIDFVEPLPGQKLMEAFADRRSEADGRACSDYALHMTLCSADISTLVEIPQVIAAGIPSFKMYTTYPGFALSDSAIIEALAAVQAAGGFAMVHAESDAILSHRLAVMTRAGQLSPSCYAESRPTICEVEAVQRVIALAEYTGASVYFAHISTADAAGVIARSRRRGLPISGETCPQYLLLDETLYTAGDSAQSARLVCAPPLRPSEHAAVLWEALQDGMLECISTDHCAFNAHGQKDRAPDNFTEVPPGLPGIEARLALMYTYGVCQGRITLQDWVRLCCTTPALRFGLRNKGRLAVGADADLVLFDPQKKGRLEASTLHEQVDYTPYEGMALRGGVRQVYLRGQRLVMDGHWVGPSAGGKFVEGER